MTDFTDFERHGFLGVESLQLSQHISATYGPYLSLFRRLNQVAWSFQYEMNIPKPENDITGAWCAILYARVLNFTQASYMLSLNGLRVQAETQLRCALEPLFKLGALKNDPKFMIEYELAERKDQLKQGRSILEYLKRQKPRDNARIKSMEVECQAKKEELILGLKNHRPQLFEKNDDKTAIEKFSVPASLSAEKAGLLDWYDLLYRMGSASIHSDAKSLESGHFLIGDDHEVEFIKNEPELEDLDEFVNTLCTVLLNAVEFVGAALGEEIPSGQLDAIKEDLMKLSELKN
ncbi:DUF5677 domain-containing protein [Rheinheimera sp. EpRS3]|uniref:DUF5677 domain-containing protein n=1 Tax=Rheinheimera sp. EpRS3 TaxID=1712383 RepID=UPI0012E36FA4|nr:DUF5677 domain-containing protein [Rheinheimera sp. EpRS3]